MRRQGDLFAQAGWTVHAFGLGEAKSSLPDWNVWPGNWTPPDQPPLPVPTPSPADADGVERALAKVSRGLSRLDPFVRKRLDAVKAWRWALFQHELPKSWRARKRPEDAVDDYLANASVRAIHDAASSIEADIYLANDWHILPAALRLARAHGGAVCYDTHEYAIEEYRQYLDWRFTRVAIAKAIEGIGLRESLVSSTVSQGIADDLQRIYRLPRAVLEIRNMPYRGATELRPCAPGVIRVLYHGLVVPDRGLEECVRSVRLWRDEFEFYLRGPVSDAFRAELERIAEQAGVAARVHFLPPVPMTDLVARAREDGDIGLFAPKPLTRHYRFVLPNKLFEYVQAGLAICVSDLPDMAKVVRAHDLGHLVAKVTEQDIADAINRFSREDVDRYKRNAVAASAELCWEVESRKMLTAYEAALDARGAGPVETR